jgi:hypothetical protein
MTADPYQTTSRLGSTELRGGPARWWRLVTVLLVAAVFVEAAFAGAMLSGVGWARAAHRASALALIAGALAASIVCLLTARRLPQGTRLGLTLLALAATLAIQAALGAATAHGANLLWLHVPIGVALVGLAGQTVAAARRLGDA